MGLPVEVNNLMMGSLNGYTIGRSLRFRSSASAYLNRTPASASNRTTWTWSAWVKKAATTQQGIFSSQSPSSSADYDSLEFYQDTIRWYFNGAIGSFLRTTAVYRDPSAWYHIVASVDTTQATASNRMKLYINGVQVTAFTNETYPSQNYNTFANNTYKQAIGAFASATSSSFFDGYLAEVNFIDGQALTPSSFGAYDTNGVWQPKKYTGTYGTNGFYLPFSNTTSTTTLVQDSSGNGNNWTPNNISLTAGTTYDSMIDSPTVSASASNYPTINPIGGSTSASITNGNLNWTGATASLYSLGTTMAIPQTGKWYMEVTLNGSTTRDCVGMIRRTTGNSSTTMPDQYNDGSWVFIYSALGYLRNYNQNLVATYSTITSGQSVGVAYDSATGKVWLNINGTWANSGNPAAGTGSVLTIPTGVDWQFCVGHYGDTANSAVNFGQRPFALTVPTGFNALNTYNLPPATIPNGAKFMAATTYTGTGASQSINNGTNTTIGTTFQPDLVWVKGRNLVVNHQDYDSLRGAGQQLQPNLTNAEATVANTVTAFNSTGFALGADTSNTVNGSTYTYVAWQWKAGGTGVTNTSGTITSTVSANPTAGFSIVTYSGNGTAGATVGHGLGVTPAFVIMKSRSLTGSSPPSQWICWHQSISQAIQTSSTIQLNNFTGAIYLNLTNASSTYGMDAQINASGQTYVAYCFAAVSGYSAFGSYTGNGSTDGPFIYTGFRPRFVLLKKTSATGSWGIYDSSRDTYNVETNALYPDLSSAETSFAALDFLSNGFKLRETAVGYNTSGATYVYACFAEHPFRHSRAR